MKNCLKKSIACMMVSGLIMGVTTPAFAEEPLMGEINSVSEVISVVENGNQNSSRIVVSKKVTVPIPVGNSDINNGQYTGPKQMDWWVMEENIRYEGVVYFKYFVPSTGGGTAYFEGTLFAVI